ncbi:hypothetical protein BFP72_00055 [Reichenbachiella sp. 5M10]|uniref:outer membrane beta-barrel protein n=1 Tax=Reichenbachiella sp. 5M10 TaxID=1889772 RepID=UPI000C14D154|nr:hypothetical protein [Reichenbachiella sp. 5M10]PIB33936.1 hypothetical protein BFP72_00055 [Reichenbachiella sp. 5M10]
MDEADQSFEQEWQAAFDQAEQTPPVHIWAAIDGHLANQKADEYKRQLLIYQWVAAACALLLLTFGVQYWTSSNMPIHDVTHNSTHHTPGSIQSSSPEQPTVSPSLDQAPSATVLDKGTSKKISPNHSQKPATLPVPVRNKKPNMEVKAGARTLPTDIMFFTSIDRQEVIYHSSLLAPELPDFLYGVPKTYLIQQEEAFATLWAGVSMSSGSFDPAFKANNAGQADYLQAPSASFAPIANENADQSGLQYDPGFSVSGGLNVGTRIKQRIILSTGLHYNAYTTGKTETYVLSHGSDYYAVTGDPTDHALASAASSDNIALVSNDVDLSNEYKYMSIPLKAGYVILDKRFNITLNTGLSSNFLLNAELVEHGATEPLSNDLNTKDNYESIYFNFISSIEFGYQFFHKYQVTLEPNYNQALTEFTNSNNLNEGKPRNIGVAFGIKYNF